MLGEAFIREQTRMRGFYPRVADRLAANGPLAPLFRHYVGHFHLKFGGQIPTHLRGR